MTAAARITVTTTAEVEISNANELPNRSPRFALILGSGDQTEVVQLTSDAPIVVGRDFPANVQIRDERASRQHARFVLRDGVVSVEDLGSRNGTYVNGRRTTHAELSPGDQVTVGKSTIALLGSKRPAAETPVERRPSSVVIQDAKMLEVYSLATRAAQTDATVLILGETGTGKEHLASTVHERSSRASGPFRAVNCAAIPEKLTDSILFGHERGAFTGADRRSAGVFEEAAGGTVFLDEVGELSRSAQASLLRVLETKKAHRVGGSKELSFDVRIVAATHCNLDKMVTEGQFREDLLYRLNTVTLEVPPLRERPGELEPLAELFLAKAGADWEIPPKRLSERALAALRAYNWPGNVRQLRNVVERSSLVSRSATIDLKDLPAPLLAALDADRAKGSPPRDTAAHDSLVSKLDRYEKHVIEEALARTGGSRPATAKLLRIPLRTLYRRIRALGASER